MRSIINYRLYRRGYQAELKYSDDTTFRTHNSLPIQIAPFITHHIKEAKDIHKNHHNIPMPNTNPPLSTPLFDTSFRHPLHGVAGPAVGAIGVFGSNDEAHNRGEEEQKYLNDNQGHQQFNKPTLSLRMRVLSLPHSNKDQAVPQWVPFRVGVVVVSQQTG